MVEARNHIEVLNERAAQCDCLHGRLARESGYRELSRAMCAKLGETVSLLALPEVTVQEKSIEEWEEEVIQALSSLSIHIYAMGHFFDLSRIDEVVDEKLEGIEEILDIAKQEAASHN